MTISKSSRKNNRIYLVGDQTSGKTTFLSEFKDSRFKVIKELGRVTVPEKIEADKLLSIIWFNLYYLERELRLKSTKPIISEYLLDIQLPYIKTNLKTKRLTKTQAENADFLTNYMLKLVPINNTDLVIHLICKNTVIRERLEKIGREQAKNKDTYWNEMRLQTKKYFKSKCNYVQIDTTKLTKRQVKEKVRAVINSYIK